MARNNNNRDNKSRSENFDKGRSDKGSMTVEEAGRKGGQKVKSLIEKGKRASQNDR